MSQTAGVKPMSIAGRTIRERERLNGMTAEERAWRKKWLHDQVLSGNEPKLIKTNTAEFMNPIRRFYRAPLDILFHKVLQPFMSHDLASVLRFYTGRGLMGLYGVYAIFYYFKYNQNDWTRKGGWRVIQTRNAVYPGEPGYPAVSQKTEPSDYHDRGFKSSFLYEKVIREVKGCK